jgi:glycosyltransferase involved in cell wall biosynthesis
MLEAMAAKLPIIATDVGGVRDVLGDNKYGKIVNPSNHIEISSAIKSLIQNYELSNKMAILGEKKVRSEYSVKAMTKQLETLYIDALN